ncbi:hypothetical protein C8Q80DRAFT_1101909, partial [Daedaleopsis nitida]
MQNDKQANLSSRPKRLTVPEDKSAAEWRQVLTEARQQILDARDAEAKSKPPKNSASSLPVNHEVDSVKLVDKQYFMDKNSQVTDPQAKELIENTVVKFSLNEAQERAFRIVANHAVDSCGEDLKMYLGGMAGTGKSQVIKALTHFFGERNESYRFMCLAPTGSAASLIGGSTYHSMLGFSKADSTESVANVMQVRSRLMNVEYIFIDEISMLDCFSMYNICAKMC